MDENVEVRSEHLQHVIGKMPSYLVRYGALVILLVVAVLFTMGSWIKYPTVFTSEGRRVDGHTITLFASEPSSLRELRAGMPVKLESNGVVIYQLLVREVASPMDGGERGWSMDIRVSLLPDTVRLGDCTYLFTTGTPLTLRWEGRSQSILQHMWNNKMR